MNSVLILHEALLFHGGGARSFLWLSRGLPMRNFHFGSLETASDSILPKMGKEGANVVSFGSKNPLILAQRVRGYIKNNNIVIIFACSFRSYYVAKLASIALSCKVVFWIRDIVIMRTVPKRILFKLLSPKDWIVANSMATLRVHSPPERSRTAVVYSGVEAPTKIDKYAAREMLGIPINALVLLYAADFKPYKDHHTLVQAFKILAYRWLNLYLVFCGREGRLRTNVVNPVMAGSTENRRILLYGPRRDMGNFFAAADIYVHPCYIESFGNAVVEAMMAGLPVVVADGGGLPEVVAEAGVLVEPRNSDAFAAEIEKLLLDEVKRSTFAAKGAKRALDQFTAEAFVERFLSVYNYILNETVEGKDGKSQSIACAK